MILFKRAILLGISIAAAASFFGCSRAEKSKGSNFSLQIPKDGLFKAESSLADRKICYGVNISAADIPSNKPDSCSLSTSILIGFVEAGQVLQAEVPQGVGRKIDLYAYLQDVGENSVCPPMTMQFAESVLKKTYLVGTVSNITLDQPEPPPISIPVTFPGVTQNIARTSGLPESCAAQSGGMPGFNISSGVETATGTTMIMHGRVGRTTNRVVLKGATIQLKVTN